MPRTKKAAGQAADPRNGRRTELSAVAVARFDLPDRGYLRETEAAWEAFWEDPVAQALTTVDRVVLLRWADHLDRALRLTHEADGDPVRKGSMGQPVENPLYSTARASLATVEKCEAQLGIGALNRARLGIAIVTERASLAALNQRYIERGTPDDEPDPRTIQGRVES
jgi:hypothetical protein